MPEGDSQNGIRIQNQLAKELGIPGNLFTQMQSNTSTNNVIFTAEKDGIYYARLTNGGTADAEAIGGALETQKFDDLKDESILYLGHLYAGETITLTNANEEDATPDVAAQIYLLNEDILQKAMQILGKQHLTDVAYDSTHLSGKLTLTEAGRMILSIPYETGWTVCLNGEEVEPALFGGTLMAFDLEPGEYELTMDYVPTGSGAGVIVTVVSVAVFVLLMLWTRRGTQKTNRKQSMGEMSNVEQMEEGEADEGGKISEECGK